MAASVAIRRPLARVSVCTVVLSEWVGRTVTPNVRDLSWRWLSARLAHEKGEVGQRVALAVPAAELVVDRDGVLVRVDGLLEPLRRG